MTRALMASETPPQARDAGLAPTSAPTAGQEHAAASADSDLAHVRTIWWYGLGTLWIIDALLQAQPSMFTASGLVDNIVLPAIAGQPGWIAGPMNWGIQLWESAPALWNTSAILLELLIGALLLFGPRRAGLYLSIAWGTVVWYFGEGLGGLFAGSPTYLAGAPGAVVLYVLLAIALLLPETAWPPARTLAGLRIGAGTLWGIGALLQLAPFFWSPLGLASVLQSVAMMPLPFGLSGFDGQLVASMAAAPIVWNTVVCAVLFGMTLVLLTGRGGTTPYIVAVAWLLFVWIVFQGLGMVFSGMSSTDLNTPPLWALSLVPGWVAARRRARTQGHGRVALPAPITRLLQRYGVVQSDQASER